jgi:arylsulfatase A-like enzyme
MVTYDEWVGELLAKLDELGIADNTIVMYSTDNGPENDTWADGTNRPFRSQKTRKAAGACRRSCAGREISRLVRSSMASSLTWTWSLGIVTSSKKSPLADSISF